jgi:hypothetical protein
VSSTIALLQKCYYGLVKKFPFGNTFRGENFTHFTFTLNFSRSGHRPSLHFTVPTKPITTVLEHDKLDDIDELDDINELSSFVSSLNCFDELSAPISFSLHHLSLCTEPSIDPTNLKSQIEGSLALLKAWRRIFWSFSLCEYDFLLMKSQFIFFS